MLPVTKRTKQAKQQCSSGSRKTGHGANGVIDDLLQLSTDPDFIPDISNLDSDLADNLNEEHTWSFSLLDGHLSVSRTSRLKTPCFKLSLRQPVINITSFPKFIVS